jgi:hypothetical protein
VRFAGTGAVKDNMGWSDWEKFGNLTTYDKKTNEVKLIGCCLLDGAERSTGHPVQSPHHRTGSDDRFSSTDFCHPQTA